MTTDNTNKTTPRQAQRQAIAKAVAELTTDPDEGTTIDAVFNHLGRPYCFWDDMEDAIKLSLIAWRDHRWGSWFDGKGATDRLLQVPAKDVRLHVGGADKTKTDIPISSHLTADEVAECVDYWQHLSEKEGEALYVKLWDILNKAANRTPIGGDGSEGTVETPCGRLSLKNDDKACHWWHKLSQREQAAISKALDLEGGAQ